MELIFDKVTKQYKNKLAVDRVSLSGNAAEFAGDLEEITGGPEAKGNLVQSWKEYYRAYAPYSNLYVLLAMFRQL